MKKIITLSAVLFISTLVTITSCKKTASNVNSFQANYNSQNLTFTQGMSMYVYTYADFSKLYGINTTTHYALTVQFPSYKPGTYTANANTAGTTYITIADGSNQITTGTTNGSGTITVTEVDTTSKWAQGTFSGTLANASTGGSNPVQISGSFSINFTLN